MAEALNGQNNIAVVDPLTFAYLARVQLGGNNNNRLTYLSDTLPRNISSSQPLSNVNFTIRNDGTRTPSLFLCSLSISSLALFPSSFYLRMLIYRLEHAACCKFLAGSAAGRCTVGAAGHTRRLSTRTNDHRHTFPLYAFLWIAHRAIRTLCGQDALLCIWKPAVGDLHNCNVNGGRGQTSAVVEVLRSSLHDLLHGEAVSSQASSRVGVSFLFSSWRHLLRHHRTGAVSFGRSCRGLQ